MADRIVEILARGWIECDPNREGGTADQTITDLPGGELQGRPRWQWFIPRAEAMRDWLNDHGFVIRPKSEDRHD
jgi:hypothetical protein